VAVVHNKDNFLLACAGLIPLLALALVIELRVWEPSERLWALPRSRTTRIVAAGGLVATAGVTVIGEVTCLHALEIGTVSHTELRTIWVMLAWLAAMVGVTLLGRALFRR